MLFTNRMTGWWRRPVAIDFKSRASVGDRVRVRSGVFEDVQGTIIDRRDNYRLILAVDLRQTGVSLEIDECRVEIIH